MSLLILLALLLQDAPDVEAKLLEGLKSPEDRVVLGSLEALKPTPSPKAIAAVARLFHDNRHLEVRRQCFAFLAGARAEIELLPAIDDEDLQIRIQAIDLFGEWRSEGAIPRLLDAVAGGSAQVKAPAEEALASIGSKAIEEVRRGVAAGRLEAALPERLETKSRQIAVERLLESQMGDDYSTGFFEGQFKNLAAYGREKAIPVLDRILNDRVYEFRRGPDRESAELFRATMKELSVMALGELGGDDALKAVRKFAADDVQQGVNRRLREETLVALHRLGDKKPIEDHLRENRQEADRLLKAETVDLVEAGTDALFSLGLLYTRLRDYPTAIKVYTELLAALDAHKLENAQARNYPTTAYNLACLHALQGGKAKAVEWLDKAVRAGFKDRGWIKKDQDLESIRGEEAYKKLITDDSLFERK